MAKIQEYRDRSVAELEVLRHDLNMELFRLRNERRGSGRMERPHLVSVTRRNIARVLTALKEKRQQQAGV